MPASDQEIIKECQNGNKEKFGLLYEKYINKIYKFIYYRTFSPELTEDLVSQTFFKALRSLDSFRGENFSAWLYQIARNNVIDHYRLKKDNISIEDVWNLREEKDWEGDLDTKNKLEEVKKIIKNLDPRQQEIILMRVWEEIPYREIAQILGKSEGSCKMAFSRAIKELKEQMPVLLLLLIILKI